MAAGNAPIPGRGFDAMLTSLCVVVAMPRAALGMRPQPDQERERPGFPGVRQGNPGVRGSVACLDPLGRYLAARRRATPTSTISPPATAAKAEGSGTGVTETPSRSAKGGRPTFVL